MILRIESVDGDHRDGEPQAPWDGGANRLPKCGRVFRGWYWSSEPTPASTRPPRCSSHNSWVQNVFPEHETVVNGSTASFPAAQRPPSLKTVRIGEFMNPLASKGYRPLEKLSLQSGTPSLHTVSPFAGLYWLKR